MAWNMSWLNICGSWLLLLGCMFYDWLNMPILESILGWYWCFDGLAWYLLVSSIGDGRFLFTGTSFFLLELFVSVRSTSWIGLLDLWLLYIGFFLLLLEPLSNNLTASTPSVIRLYTFIKIACLPSGVNLSYYLHNPRKLARDASSILEKSLV